VNTHPFHCRSLYQPPKAEVDSRINVKQNHPCFFQWIQDLYRIFCEKIIRKKNEENCKVLEVRGDHGARVDSSRSLRFLPKPEQDPSRIFECKLDPEQE